MLTDEAGSVSETEAYIPLSGLGLSKKGIHAQVVLSGDHKQLGPIVTNAFAKKMGLEVSCCKMELTAEKKFKFLKNFWNLYFSVQ